MSTNAQQIAGDKPRAADAAQARIERNISSDAGIDGSGDRETPGCQIDRDVAVVGGNTSRSDDQAIGFIDSERFS